MNCVIEMNRNTGETSTRSRKWGPVQFFTSGGAVQLMHCSRFEMPRLTVGQIGRFHIGFSALLHPQKFQDERDFARPLAEHEQASLMACKLSQRSCATAANWSMTPNWQPGGFSD